MVNKELEQQLKNAGFKVTYNRFNHWDNILYVDSVAVAKMSLAGGMGGCLVVKTDYTFNQVLKAMNAYANWSDQKKGEFGDSVGNIFRRINSEKEYFEDKKVGAPGTSYASLDELQGY